MIFVFTIFRKICSEFIWQPSNLQVNRTKCKYMRMLSFVEHNMRYRWVKNFKNFTHCQCHIVCHIITTLKPNRILSTHLWFVMLHLIKSDFGAVSKRPCNVQINNEFLLKIIIIMIGVNVWHSMRIGICAATTAFKSVQVKPKNITNFSPSASARESHKNEPILSNVVYPNKKYI